MNSSKQFDDEPARHVAVPLALVTPHFVDGLRAYIRMWRRASVNGPFLLTADNFYKVLTELYCDVGMIREPYSPDSALQYGAMETEGLKWWLRDNFFEAASARPAKRIEREAALRHRFIASVIAAADPDGAERFGFAP